jgi:hypothetical protein
VAEGEPPDRGRVEHSRDGLLHSRKERLEAGVEEERLFVLHQILVELQIKGLDVSRNAVDVRRGFVDGRHRWALLVVRGSQSQ